MLIQGALFGFHIHNSRRPTRKDVQHWQAGALADGDGTWHEKMFAGYLSKACLTAPLMYPSFIIVTASQASWWACMGSTRIRTRRCISARDDT